MPCGRISISMSPVNGALNMKYRTTVYHQYENGIECMLNGLESKGSGDIGFH